MFSISEQWCTTVSSQTTTSRDHHDATVASSLLHVNVALYFPPSLLLLQTYRVQLAVARRQLAFVERMAEVSTACLKVCSVCGLGAGHGCALGLQAPAQSPCAIIQVMNNIMTWVGTTDSLQAKAAGMPAMCADPS